MLVVEPQFPQFLCDLADGIVFLFELFGDIELVLAEASSIFFDDTLDICEIILHFTVLFIEISVVGIIIIIILALLQLLDAIQLSFVGVGQSYAYLLQFVYFGG